MLVCHCLAVNDREIKTAIRQGAATVDDVIDLTDAGGMCGGCHPSICRLLRAHPYGACGGDVCLASGRCHADPSLV